MRADSFITSPSCPVRTSSPCALSIEVASTKRTSPPVPVTARPVATPGTGRPVRRLLEELLAAQRVPYDVHVDHDGCLDLAGGDAGRSLAQHGGRAQRVELADARLARVLGDDHLDRLVGNRDLVLAQPVPLDLPRPEIAAERSPSSRRPCSRRSG